MRLFALENLVSESRTHTILVALITPSRPGTLRLEVELKSPLTTLHAVAPLIVR